MLAFAVQFTEQTVLSLREHEHCELALPESDVAFLAAHFTRRIRIERGTDADVWSFNPQSHVGIVHLPSGRLLRCEPKLPVQNIFHMLATVLRFPSPFRDEPVQYDDFEELFDFVVEHFANLVQIRLERGLYRSYIEREENLLTIRGRILTAPDIRQNYILRHRTYCQFTEFSWDLPENRVIRQAVHSAFQMVKKRDLRKRLAEVDQLLGELDPTPLPLSVFDRFTYHRLNDDYEPIHRLARLILEGSSVSEELGEVGFRAFLLDMNLLFEQYVEASLIERMKPPISVSGQVKDRLDTDRRVPIKPDLVFYRDHQPVLIADCKYKRQTDEAFRNADLYQVLAYCTAFDLSRGALIYPRWEVGLKGEVVVRNSDVRIRHFDVDLSVDVGVLPAVMDDLASALFEWADTGHMGNGEQEPSLDRRRGPGEGPRADA